MSSEHAPIEPADADDGHPVIEPSRPTVDGPKPTGRDPLITGLIFLTVVLAILVSFLGGIWAERNLNGSGSGPLDADRLNEVAGLLDAEYYRGPLDEAARASFDDRLEQSALVGLASGAGDPYTSYLPPDTAAPLTEQLSGQYGGIGVTVQQRDGRLVIVQVLPDGPAEAAGVRPDDVLLSVDGTDLAGATTADAGALIRGEVGTTVSLALSRTLTGEQLTVPVERRQLDAPVVVYSLDPATGIARFSVSGFTGVTTRQLDQALAQARTDGAAGLILDLRGNGGGSVTAAQEMIGRFVPAQSGPALYETVGRAGDSDQVSSLPIIAPDGGVSDLPLVVLVDGGTASAAEIVAASLRDYGRATVIGSPSFGKGSVQRVHTFNDDAILKVTIAEWLTPDHQRLDGVGVSLDVEVAAGSPDDARDDQLVAATAYLVSGGASGADFGW
jgi:carboxyl-terminal processing protease